jgi:8-oxo-dGTP pyrophosphatase MutT (NUDIX family)
MGMSARVSQRPGRPASEQVAAVCYRIGSRGLEFLLIRTRARRWTFPKGGLEPGLTYAQTAALEAVEEAGVHGRIEEAPFAHYLHRKRGGKEQLSSGSSHRVLVVQAHLCEVLRLGRSRERGRDRTWVSAEKAKRRLRQGRTHDEARELLPVVDRAINRIQRLNGGVGACASVPQQDPLQKVRFEPSGTEVACRRLEAAPVLGYIRRTSAGTQRFAEVELAVDAYFSEVLESNFSEHDKPEQEAARRRLVQRGKVLQLAPSREIKR